MARRFFAAVLCWWAMGIAAGNCLAQTPVELEPILRRLEQQETELRQLRFQLGTLQEEVRALPPVTETPPLPSYIPATNGVLPASHDSVQPASAANTVFELQERMASLEQRLDQQALSSKEQLDAAVASYDVGSDLAMTASWNNGLELRTKNKDFRVHIGGRTQLDISAFQSNPELTQPQADGGIGPQPDSIQFRRARIRIDGTMWEVFEFVAEYDFANALGAASPTAGQPAVAVPGVTDLYVTWTQLPVVGNFRVGNMKECIGMEHLQSTRWLDFIERSFLQDAVFGPFNNGFNPGLMFFNWTDDEMGTWWVGAFANNSNIFGYGLGDDWAVTARTTRLLWYDEPSNGRYLFHVGAAGSVRHPDEDQVRVRARGDIRSGPPGILNPIYADTGTMEASQQELVCAEAAGVWGPWSMQAEYVGTWVESAVQPFASPEFPVERGTPFFHGGYVQVMYFLTGESRPYNRRLGAFDRVIPFENAFCVSGRDGACKGLGAWQVGVRYNALDLNDNGINGGILHAGTFGVNWWLNPNAHVAFNYDLTHRSQVQDVQPGYINAFGVRFAHDF